MGVEKKGFIAGFMLLIASFVFASTGAASFAAEGADKILARIDDSVITQAEFNRELESMHMIMLESQEGAVTASAINFSGVMHRLINLRLLAMEARNIGLDKQPEFQKSIDQYRQQQLKQAVMGQVVKDNPVTKEDKDVQDLYHRLSRELRLHSMLFETEDQAEEAKTMIEQDGFVAVAEKMQDAEGVQVSLDEGFIPIKEFRPYVGQIAIDMQVDDVSPIFRAADGYMIFELAEVKQIDDEDVLQQAFSMEIEKKHNKAKTALLDSLVDKHATVNEKLLAQIDFSSNGPPTEDLKKDNRVLAIIDMTGQEKIEMTVADLTQIMADKYYHGMEKARKSRSLNEEKATILRKKLMGRLLLAEAKRRGIENTAEFQQQMFDYENRMLFTEMVRKVIGPDVSFTNEQVEEYYNKNKQDFSTPGMVRMSSVPFSSADYAEQAAEMLLKGADFAWISINAPGQVKSDEANLTRMNRQVVSVTGMPDDVREALGALDSGQSTWYQDEAGLYQVVYLNEVIPRQERPLDDVRVEIEKTVFRNNVSEAINDYAEKAREHYTVEIYDPELRREESVWQRIKSFFN